MEEDERERERGGCCSGNDIEIEAGYDRGGGQAARLLSHALDDSLLTKENLDK